MKVAGRKMYSVVNLFDAMWCSRNQLNLLILATDLGSLYAQSVVKAIVKVSSLGD